MQHEELVRLLDDAERGQLQILGAILDEPGQIARLKDAVLFLLDVLCQVEGESAQGTTLEALRRVFSPCVAYLHDSRAFLDGADGQVSACMLMSPRQGAKKGNVVLKALLGTITALTSRSSFYTDTILGLVEMVRELCAQSINSVDVIMLFDFLRLGQPPARRWLLQMQKALVEMPPTPRAIFSMKGSHAGIIATSNQAMLTKKGYSFSAGIYLDPGAPTSAALYSFRGQQGHGVAATLDGNSLVIKSFTGQLLGQQIDIPFREWRQQMDGGWAHLCVVHAKKMVFKDKVTVYVDGKLAFNGNLPYPDSANMAGGHNSIGVAPSGTGIQGKLWSPTVFGLPLSETEVQKLHWRTHWKNDLSSVAAENVGLTDKSKFVCSYDARNCDLDRRICLDISGNECHGWLEPGTSTFVTQSFVQALDSIGGCACFLLLLLDQIPEMADFHPKTELSMQELSDLLAFVGTALRYSIECRAHFVRLRGVNVVEFVLQSISPSYLSVELLDGVVCILDAHLGVFESDSTLLSDYIHRLLFLNPSWFLSPFETQVKLLEEVLPTYLQLFQDHKARHSMDPSVENALSSTSSGSSSQNGLLFVNTEHTREVDVDFFCNLIVQVYLIRESVDGEEITTAHMDPGQLKRLRGLIYRNLIGRLLAGPSVEASIAQWEQLFAHICRRCNAVGSSDCVDVEEMLAYLTEILNSDQQGRESGKQAAVSRQQLTNAICRVSKGTLRVLWRPMLSPIDGVRFAALRFFESYTSDKVLLQRKDILMLCSAFQAHILTSATCDLLLNIVIGRRTTDRSRLISATSGVASSRLTHGSAVGTRAMTMSRLEYVPLVLLGLVHNADAIIQMKILVEIKIQMMSSTMGGSIKESVRSWPPWMSRLHAVAVRSLHQANLSCIVSSPPADDASQVESLNDACMTLIDDSTQLSAKMEALSVIAAHRDVRGCDFALSALQNNMRTNAAVTVAIVDMVKDHFPQRSDAVVVKLANQIVVDIVVYSILHVRNGWMHLLELYFYYGKDSSILCSLVTAVCQQTLKCVTSKSSTSNFDVVWENMSQVASIVSQTGELVTLTVTKLGVVEATLSSGQHDIFVRNAFDLWLCVLPHIYEVKWEELAAHLALNSDYGSDVTIEEKEIFSCLAADFPHARDLALSCAAERLRLADFSMNGNGLELIDSFAKLLLYLKLIPFLPHKSPMSSSSFSSCVAASVRASVLSSSSGVQASPDGCGSTYKPGADGSSGLHTDSADVSCGVNEQRRAHLVALDICFAVFEQQPRGDCSDIQVFRLLVRAMISLAISANIVLEAELSDELEKTLQIMAATEVEFFQEQSQIDELVALWRLHWEALSLAGAAPSRFSQRWAYVIERHSLDFNPYLIQKYSTIQADTLGNEIQMSEQLWGDIIDSAAVAAAANRERDEDEDEPRGVRLKQDVDKFASSIHKLIVRSRLSIDSEPRPSESSDAESSTFEEDVAGDPTEDTVLNGGMLLKVSSNENALRMRLRLKEVPSNYRIRNLSCECAGSGFLDTESRGSGKILSHRLLGSLEQSGGVGDLDKSWRSDADSDYSDFLSDAQMRAAIIRSTSNADEQGGPSSDEFSDEGDCNDNFYDTDDEEFVSPSTKSRVETGDYSAEHAASTVNVQDESVGDRPAQTIEDFIAGSGPTVDTERDSQQFSSSVGADAAGTDALSSPVPSATSPPTSSSSQKSVASSASTALSFGASMLSAVGGVAGFMQKAAKDAKDVVEYSVDSLYTTKDAWSEEAQSLIEGVSTYMDDNLPRVADDEQNSSKVGKKVPPITTEPDIPSISTLQASMLSPTNQTKVGPSGKTTRATPRSTVAAPSSASRSKREMQFNAKLIRHMHAVEGRLIIADTMFGFLADRVVDEHDEIIVERNGPSSSIGQPWRFLFKNRRWRIDDIVGLHRRRYLLKPTALEVFFLSNRKNYFFNFASGDLAAFHEALMARRPLLIKRDPTVRRLRNPSSIFRNSNMTARWVNHEISTFEYLMWLNTIAGRTYNDLTQYPVFPWVIADYESPTLDLTRRGTFRDLTKPIGALEPSRHKFFLDRYHAFDDPDIPKFMYGTHYSNIGAVLNYLIRLEPFTSYAMTVQGGKFDHADRLFHSIAETWQNCLTDFTDLKELIPEWFYLPEFLVNRNGLDLGIRQSGVPVNDVVLPPWARSPEDFVLKNLLALESEYVSGSIHHWIDLVFGAKQRGPAAVAASNVFFYLTYEGMVDIDSIDDPVLKSSMRSQVAHFGQTPSQVLRDPHPERHPLARQLLGRNAESSVDRAISPRGTNASAIVDAGVTQLVVPHEAPIVHISMVRGTSSLLCLDANGMLSTHRYGCKPSKVHNTHHHHSPFQSSSATRAASVFKGSHVGYSPLVSPTNSGATGGELVSSQYIELQDRKCHKVLGDKRLFSVSDLNAAHSVAFLNAGAVICSVGHHDFSARFHSASDGALLYRLLQHSAVVTCLDTSELGTTLVLGSADGTLSVWKVAHINSTLLDSLKIFRKGESKPVHANDYAADQVLLGHSAMVNCVSVSEELGLCISGSAANDCLVHNLEDGSIIRQFDVPGKLAPGVISTVLSNIGRVIVQSVGTGGPVLYSFHLNGKLLAKVSLGVTPMTFVEVSDRFSRVVVSNSERAIALPALTLDRQDVLIEKSNAAGNSPITSQALAPDEVHVMFGVGSGRVVCVPLLPPTPLPSRTEM